MILLLPVINILGLVYFVGGDIKDVKAFYHNDDHNCMLTECIRYVTRFVKRVLRTHNYKY